MNEKDLGRFVVKENGKVKKLALLNTVITDTMTGVQYLFAGDGLTVLVDENGRPLVDRSLKKT